MCCCCEQEVLTRVVAVSRKYLHVLLLQAMLEHGAVAEAAVIPVPDKLKGHVPLGFYVLKAGMLPFNLTKTV